MTARELRKALLILLVAEAGLEARQASEVLGISERTIFRDRSGVRYQDEGKGNTWGGRRHYVLSMEDERDFLRTWEEKANQGGALSVPPIHVALVKRFGRSIPIFTTYRLLARHGWRKVQPDTKHPKSQPSTQEEFKKNWQGLWRPPL